MALTQAELDKLNAQHEAVQKELFDIVTKRGVSAEQREIDNARIKVLNKRAADIVKQQRSAQGIVDDTPSKPAPKPRDTSTSQQNLSPNEVDKLNSLKTKREALEREQAALTNAQKQGQPPDPKIKQLQNQIASTQKEIDDAIYKGSKPPGEPLINQQGANVGEPSQIPANVRQADELLAAAGGREGRVPGGVFGRSEPDTSRGSPDVIPDRRPLPDGPVLPNELHQYPSYTYGISLHLLTNQEYNDIVVNQTFKPNRVLISSAGRHDPNTFPRSPFFNEDFYFDDLEIETVIVPNAVTSNTNAIRLTFTIIEPYGFSLIDRLIEAAKDLKLGTYLGMPYLLEIDFFAHNDAGEIVGKLSNISKRIPINLLTMDVQASAKGTEYRITATPINHSAFSATTITVPDHMEIVAGSISEFFGTNNAEIDQAADRDDSTREGLNNPAGPASSAETKVNKYQRQKSMSDALNAYYLDLKTKNLALTNDRYYFKFDKEILDYQGFASIDLGLSKPKNMKMAGSKDANSIRVSNVPNGPSSDAFDLQTKAFSINAGTTIEKVITQVVCMSNYIQSQLAVPEDFNGDIAKFKAKLASIKDIPLSWFRIVPIVTLGEWDSRKQAWRRDITYHVQTYQIKNVKMDIAPQQAATSPIKRYDYLYTGKNNDIIDWDLKFNLLYYNAVTVHKNAAAYLSNYGTSNEGGESTPSPNSLEETKLKGITQSAEEIDYNSVMPMAYKNIISNDQTLAGTDETTARAMAISDLKQSVTIQEGADMMQVKLKIIGDPAYIKQDDVFYPPTAFDKVDEPDQSVDQRLTANGSLRTDYGQLNVRLTFQQPRDIEEDKSLTFTKPATSLFSGLFLLVSVVSNFSQGVFTQVLNLVRLTDQPNSNDTNPTPLVPVERVADETATGAEAAGAVTDEPAALPPPSADPDEGSKAAAVPAEEAVPPVDPEQKNLANVAATSPTQTITAATAPQAVVPNPNAGKIKDLQSDLDRANASLSQQQFNVDSQRNLISIAEQNLARARATNNEAEITTWQNSIAERTRTLATLQNQFNDAKSKVDGINSQISALQ